MRVLGIDVGEIRIGLALSDPLGITAQPLTTLTQMGEKRTLSAINEVIKKNNVERVVVGIPLSLKGTQGPQAQRVQIFIDRLRLRVEVPVESVDERFTTAQSQRALKEMGTARRKRKEVIDQMAAQLILQNYLDGLAGRA